MTNKFAKRLLITVCLFMVYKVSAQDITTRGDTMILKNGAKFWIGEQINLGNPSSPNGGFTYVYFPEVLHITKKRPLNAKYFGRQVTIKKFQRDGAYKGGLSYNIIVLELDRLRYWCDVAPALDSKEIINPNANIQQKHSGGVKERPHNKKANAPPVF